MKVCVTCSKEKVVDDFDYAKVGRRNTCKKCRSSQYKSLRKARLSTLEGLLQERMKDVRRRGKKRGVDIDVEYLLALYEGQRGKCAISGLPMTIEARDLGYTNSSSVISVDRIDSSIGYLKGNVQLVCCSVNTMKSNMNQKDFLELCKLIVKNNKE